MRWWFLAKQPSHAQTHIFGTHASPCWPLQNRGLLMFPRAFPHQFKASVGKERLYGSVFDAERVFLMFRTLKAVLLIFCLKGEGLAV